MNSENYQVNKLNKKLDISIKVPGSKSISNRALLMAALSDGVTTLNGVLFSDDSRHFIASLKSLGFVVEVNEADCIVTVHGCNGKIPYKNGEIYVGSAGTAARFLTAMLGLSDGEYVINASEQMKARPMEALFKALEEMGASFEYMEKPYCLPVRVKGCGSSVNTVNLDISRSTQFLSALLMTAPMVDGGLSINITSEKKDGAYIRITRRMMADFGCSVDFDGRTYHVKDGQKYKSGSYNVEPDVSAACYFYAMAAITGGKALVRNVFYNTTQGDIKFIGVLCDMGCKAVETADGIVVTGPENGHIHGVDIDMNDFSDQALTLAAIAPFADSDVTIRNIGHIRGQECDRINAMAVNLSAMGIDYTELSDGIIIHPGRVQECTIKTFDDHRVAMAFCVAGIVSGKMTIENPMCCRKTFENYFDIIDSILAR